MPHTRHGAALRPATAAVVEISAGLDWASVSPLGSRGDSSVRESQSSKDGVNACVVPPGGFGGAAGFSVLMLRDQE